MQVHSHMAEGHCYQMTIGDKWNDWTVDSFIGEGMSDESIRLYFLGLVEDIVSEVALMSELKGNSNIVSYEDHSVVELKDSSDGKYTSGWRCLRHCSAISAIIR